MESFHGAMFWPQCFGGNHKILPGQLCSLRRPLEQVLSKHWWHPDRLPQIHQPKNRPLDRTKNAERSWHEQDPADLRRALVVSDFGVAEAALAHPLQLGLRRRCQRPDVGHRNHQRRRRCLRRLSKAESLPDCLSVRRCHPKQPVRLHIETGGSMARCIEDLFTQFLWDFDRLKALTARLWKSASRISLMRYLYVAITT